MSQSKGSAKELDMESPSNRSAGSAIGPTKHPFSRCGQYIYLFVDQVVMMSKKSLSQKRRKGRQFIKDTFLIQFCVLIFFSWVLNRASQSDPSSSVYSKFSLPPLSDKGDYGIFSRSAKGNNEDTLLSTRLYYSPNDHDGVKDLIKALTKEYPDLEATGFKDAKDIEDEYEKNLFNTWASLEFDLSADQKSSGQLVTSQTNPSKVSYAFRINPSNWENSLPTSSYQDPSWDVIFNDESCKADLFWSTGFLTVQNFVAAHLARQYTAVDDDFSVETELQRYPANDIYEDKTSFSMTQVRFDFWRWMGGVLLSICVFLPMLGLLTEVVRERQHFMKDLLEISGLMNVSYWVSYLLVALLLCQLTIWFSVLLLTASNVLSDTRILPYVDLLTCYSVSVATVAFLFGFVVFRSEYYGLPVFMLNSALAVCGAYLGIATSISVGGKLFLCFLSPSVALSMGVIVIETYLKRRGGSMDYNYVAEDLSFPSLNSINGMMLLSMACYLGATIGMPHLQWAWMRLKGALSSGGSGSGGRESMEILRAKAKAEAVKYPCDIEGEDNQKRVVVDADGNRDGAPVAAAVTASSATEGTEAAAPSLLRVSHLTHIYPDGTHAVKDVSFKVREGEVLSFLGANGAGKSTCMGMLCGTLDATLGDAFVGGHSITNERTLARRNLGIAMQQDIIWDDVNVEDHLLLFGRLRGLHGAELRESVKQMADSLGFPDKVKSMAGTLSGGQKRRLCVGLSMVGGNQVVFLDEPTAGLDPVSRRQLWELVQRNRHGRAILLTTHFMDEADVLGDRIAVVKEGRLRAMGTSKYLKRRFGLGYLLRMSLASGTGGEGGDSAGHAAAATGDGKVVVSAHVAAGAIEVEEVEEQKKDEPHHTEGSSQNKNNTASSSSSSAAAATAVAERVQRRVQEFVKEATLASSAGTELSLRLPREAVPRFPELFEALETEGKELGVTSYGIETSTLEEVFMRIVNEDTESLLQDHEGANRLLGSASREEREAAEKALQQREEQRNPINQRQLCALLTKGRRSRPRTLSKRQKQQQRDELDAASGVRGKPLAAVRVHSEKSDDGEKNAAHEPVVVYADAHTGQAAEGGGGGNDDDGADVDDDVPLLPQVQVMVEKRFYQFLRSKGQWSMGVGLPIVLAILTGLLISTAPTDPLSNTKPLFAVEYDDSFGLPIPLAGDPQADAEGYFDSAFAASPNISSVYVGSDEKDLQDYIDQITDNGGAQGASSTNAIAYNDGNVNDFFVMYNASYPTNLAATVGNALQAAIDDATGELLTVDMSYSSLPGNRLGAQLNSGFYIAMIVGLLTGSLGAGMSIVLSGERTMQVKHQQLASGASRVAYWLGNFCFDIIVMMWAVLLVGLMLASFKPDSYAGASSDGFGYVLLTGIFYAIASIFRFYIVSYFIEDVRLAQSIYFYGMVGIMFAMLIAWFNVLFNTANGNASHPAVATINVIFTLIEPAFGWSLLIMYLNNYLAVLTQNEGKEFLSQPGGPIFSMLIVSCFLYGAIFILITENGLGYLCRRLWAACCGKCLSSSSSPGSDSGNKSRAHHAAELARNKCVSLALTDGNPSKRNKDGNSSGARDRGSTMSKLDADVEAERQRVQAALREDQLALHGAHAIFINQLSKIYYAKGTAPSKVAVKDMSLAIPRGEVFGLLGANGAGKTTLLKMVSGQETPSAGVALVNGYDVVEQTGLAQRSMGLCPQFDTLIDRLTVKENLLFFGRLKGLHSIPTATPTVAAPETEATADGHGGHGDPAADVESGAGNGGAAAGTKVVGARVPTVTATTPTGPDETSGDFSLEEVAEAFMLALSIKRYENKRIQHLSGGNRRKVSLAVALLGAPPTVYLDEPSTGLDPVACRHMWRLLSRIAAARTTAMVLTTHNMLECEAVCTRVGIMKLGQLVCLGDNLHLRSTHGTGFLLEMSLQSPALGDAAKEFMSAQFSGAVVVDEQATMLNFEIPRASIGRISEAFRLLEQHKQSLGIVDYALSQSTLEQVFLKQIRPNDSDARALADQAELDNGSRGRPFCRDYVTGYFVFLLALFLPGLHHFYLGNTWRGVQYLFTLNQFFAGWLLDLFEMHVLIQQSVQQFGHVDAVCICRCCGCAACCGACCGEARHRRLSGSSVGCEDREDPEETPAGGAGGHKVEASAGEGGGGNVEMVSIDSEV